MEQGAEFVPLRLVLQPRGTVIVLDRTDMVLGRQSNADIRLPMPDVSRRHCRFTWTDSIWKIHDLHSLNGVYINGEKVDDYALKHKDYLRVGAFVFLVDLSYPAELVRRLAS